MPLRPGISFKSYPTDMLVTDDMLPLSVKCVVDNAFTPQPVLKDYSINDVTYGTYGSGAITAEPNGKFGESLGLQSAASSRIALGMYNPIEGNKFTLEFWSSIPNSLMSSTGKIGLFNLEKNGRLIRCEVSKDYINLYSDNSISYKHYSFYTGPWRHMAVTIDSVAKTFKLYVHGALVYTGTDNSLGTSLTVSIYPVVASDWTGTGDSAGQYISCEAENTYMSGYISTMIKSDSLNTIYSIDGISGLTSEWFNKIGYSGNLKNFLGWEAVSGGIMFRVSDNNGAITKSPLIPTSSFIGKNVTVETTIMLNSGVPSATSPKDCDITSKFYIDGILAFKMVKNMSLMVVSAKNAIYISNSGCVSVKIIKAKKNPSWIMGFNEYSTFASKPGELIRFDEICVSEEIKYTGTFTPSGTQILPSATTRLLLKMNTTKESLITYTVKKDGVVVQNTIGGNPNDGFTYPVQSSGLYQINATGDDFGAGFIQDTLVGAPFAVTVKVDLQLFPMVIVANDGDYKTCTATVSGGSTPYTFNWFVDDQLVATESVLSRAFPISDDGKTLKCKVTCSDGAVVEETVGINVNPARDEFRITRQPEDASFVEGGSLSLSIDVAGGERGFVYNEEIAKDCSYLCHVKNNNTHFIAKRSLDNEVFFSYDSGYTWFLHHKYLTSTDGVFLEGNWRYTAGIDILTDGRIVVGTKSVVNNYTSMDIYIDKVYVNRILNVNQGTLCVVGDTILVSTVNGDLYRSSDFGVSFQKIVCPVGPGGWYNFYKIANGEVWLPGVGVMAILSYTGELIRTISLNSESLVVQLEDECYLVFSRDNNGENLYTNDSGKTFVNGDRYRPQTDWTLYCGYHNGVGFVGSQSERMTYVTKDGGVTWSSVYTNYNTMFANCPNGDTAIFGMDSAYRYVVQYAWIMRKKTDDPNNDIFLGYKAGANGKVSWVKDIATADDIGTYYFTMFDPGNSMAPLKSRGIDVSIEQPQANFFTWGSSGAYKSIVEALDDLAAFGLTEDLEIQMYGDTVHINDSDRVVDFSKYKLNGFKLILTNPGKFKYLIAEGSRSDFIWDVSGDANGVMNILFSDFMIDISKMPKAFAHVGRNNIEFKNARFRCKDIGSEESCIYKKVYQSDFTVNNNLFVSEPGIPVSVLSIADYDGKICFENCTLMGMKHLVDSTVYNDNLIMDVVNVYAHTPNSPVFGAIPLEGVTVKSVASSYSRGLVDSNFLNVTPEENLYSFNNANWTDLNFAKPISRSSKLVRLSTFPPVNNTETFLGDAIVATNATIGYYSFDNLSTKCVITPSGTNPAAILSHIGISADVTGVQNTFQKTSNFGEFSNKSSMSVTFDSESSITAVSKTFNSETASSVPFKHSLTGSDISFVYSGAVGSSFSISGIVTLVTEADGVHIAILGFTKTIPNDAVTITISEITVGIITVSISLEGYSNLFNKEIVDASSIDRVISISAKEPTYVTDFFMKRSFVVYDWYRNGKPMPWIKGPIFNGEVWYRDTISCSVTDGVTSSTSDKFGTTRDGAMNIDPIVEEPIIADGIVAAGSMVPFRFVPSNITPTPCRVSHFEGLLSGTNLKWVINKDVKGKTISMGREGVFSSWFYVTIDQECSFSMVVDNSVAFGVSRNADGLSVNSRSSSKLIPQIDASKKFCIYSFGSISGKFRVDITQGDFIHTEEFDMTNLSIKFPTAWFEASADSGSITVESLDVIHQSFDECVVSIWRELDNGVPEMYKKMALTSNGFNFLMNDFSSEDSGEYWHSYSMVGGELESTDRFTLSTPCRVTKQPEDFYTIEICDYHKFSTEITCERDTDTVSAVWKKNGEVYIVDPVSKTGLVNEFVMELSDINPYDHWGDWICEFTINGTAKMRTRVFTVKMDTFIIDNNTPKDEFASDGETVKFEVIAKRKYIK